MCELIKKVNIYCSDWSSSDDDSGRRPLRRPHPHASLDHHPDHRLVGARGHDGIPAVRLAGEVPHEQGDVPPVVRPAEAPPRPPGHQLSPGAAGGEARRRGPVAPGVQRGIPHHQRAVRCGQVHRMQVCPGHVSRNRGAACSRVPAAARRAGAGGLGAALPVQMGLSSLRCRRGNAAHRHHHPVGQRVGLRQPGRLALGADSGMDTHTPPPTIHSHRSTIFFSSSSSLVFFEVVVGGRGQFWDVCASFPGGTEPADVLQNSSLWATAADGGLSPGSPPAFMGKPLRYTSAQDRSQIFSGIFNPPYFQMNTIYEISTSWKSQFHDGVARFDMHTPSHTSVHTHCWCIWYHRMCCFNNKRLRVVFIVQLQLSVWYLNKVEVDRTFSHRLSLP